MSPNDKTYLTTLGKYTEDLTACATVDQCFEVMHTFNNTIENHPSGERLKILTTNMAISHINELCSAKCKMAREALNTVRAQTILTDLREFFAC